MRSSLIMRSRQPPQQGICWLTCALSPYKVQAKQITSNLFAQAIYGINTTPFTDCRTVSSDCHNTSGSHPMTVTLGVLLMLSLQSTLHDTSYCMNGFVNFLCSL